MPANDSMRPVRLILFFSLGFSFASLSIAGSATCAFSAEQVFEKAVEARGGRDALMSIHSFHAKGTVFFQSRFGPWWDAASITNVWPLEIRAMRPGRFRFGVNLKPTQGASSAFVPPRYYDNGYDGRTAWEVLPGRAPQILPGIFREERSEQGKFFAWCAEPANYFSATNLGVTLFSGQPCHELKLVRRSGNQETHFYNTTNCLLVGIIRSSVFGPSLERFTFSDYREFSGFKFPMRTDYEVEDERDMGQVRSIEKLDSVVINAIEESCFRMPASSRRFENDGVAPTVKITVAEVKTLLRDWVEDDKLADGVVVALVDERGRWVAGHGTVGKSLTKRKKIDGKSPFGIASISKVFTRLLLLDMVQRGEVKLDDPAQQYLPESVRLPKRNGKEITLLHLATHTSGLPRYFSGSQQEVYSQLSQCKLERDPGETYEYSNLGMGLLGKAIEHKADRPYWQLIAERICRPLGMKHTTVMNCDFPGIDGVESCADDLAKFGAACVGLQPTPPVLSALMQHLYATHGGAGGNGCMYLAVDPVHRRALVTLAATWDGHYNFALAKLNRLMLNQSPQPPRAIQANDSLYDRYVGQYLSDDNSAWMVRRQGYRLLLQPLRGPSCEIFPLSESYFLNQMTGLDATFFAESSDKSPRLVLHELTSTWVWQGHRISSQTATRSVRVTLAPLIAEDCAGQYKASDGAIIVVRFDGDNFTAESKSANSGDSDLECLQAESESCFTSISGPAAFTFLRDSSGKVTSLIRHVYGSNSRYDKFAPAPPCVSSADLERFVGNWETVIDVPNAPKMRAAIKISRSGGSSRATLDYGEIRKHPFDSLVALDRCRLFLTGSFGHGQWASFCLALNEDATELRGTGKCGPQRVVVAFKRM